MTGRSGSVTTRVAGGRVRALLERCLRAGVLADAQGWQPTERGTPQGGVISPLLANLCLKPLDPQRARAGHALGCQADHFVILSHPGAAARAAGGERRG